MIMKVAILFLLNLIVAVLSVSNRNLKALSDEEYDLMIRKITGRYNIPVAERSVKETRLLRKYYRWICLGNDLSVGPSGKTIYINGKQLVRKEEIERTIKLSEKESKNSGIRKLTGRIQNRYIGCSEKNVATSKSNSKSLQVIYLFVYI